MIRGRHQFEPRRQSTAAVKTAGRPHGRLQQHGDTEDSELALTEQASFTALMQAITGCQNTLTTKIDSLQIDVDLLRRDIDKIQGRITEAERRVWICDHSACLHRTKVKALESRAKDSENRNQHNNLCIPGLPGGAEEEAAFTEQLLRSLFPPLSHLSLRWREPIECHLPEAPLGREPALLFFA